MNPGFDLSLLGSLAAGLILGAGLVFMLMRRGGTVNRERAESLTTELDETRLDLESHREEVSKHFAETSDLFRDLTEQYTRLYVHLASGAREFCPDEVPSLGQGLDTPLLVDESPRTAATPEPPKEKAPVQAAPADEAAEPAAADRKADGKLAVDAPVPSAAPPPPSAAPPPPSAAPPPPSAAPPPVRSKPNGGSPLTH
jgi:uncharacterized membrane-anchored protein YhcB (DUF1043 family)